VKAVALLIFDKCLYLRGRLWLKTARRLSAYMSSKALATTTTSSLLLNSCDGNNAFWRYTMLMKQSSLFSRKHRNLSLQNPDLCPANSPVNYRICELMQERVHIVQTPVCDTSRCDQRLEAAPRWHVGKHNHKTSSTKQLVNGESGCVQAWRQMTSLWKLALFRANTLTIYWGKLVDLRHFHRSY